MYSTHSIDLASLTEPPIRHDQPHPPAENTRSRARPPKSSRWGVVLVMVGLFFGLAGAAGAAIEVTTTAASSTSGCTLADAIATAQAGFDVGACTGTGEIQLEAATYETDGVLPFVIDAGKKITIQGVVTTTTATIERDDGDLARRLFRVESGTLELNAVTLTSKNSDFRVAAVKVFEGATLDLSYCRFDDNRSWRNSGPVKGGAIKSFGTLEVYRCVFDGNSAADGGAIYIASGSAVITKSTFVDNVAVDDDGIAKGGAIFVKGGGELGLENSTFSSNDAEQGGALAVIDGSATMQMCTFKDNTADTSGSAILVDSSNTGTVEIERSALAGCKDCSPAVSALCDGPVTSNDNNAAEDATCGLNQPNDQVEDDLQLSDLNYNHGLWTPVHVPLCDWSSGTCDSPLIDQYPCDGIEDRDQRDYFPREDPSVPTLAGELCDIGAYESVCADVSTPSAGVQHFGLHGYNMVYGEAGTKIMDNGSCSGHRLDFGDETADCKVEWEIVRGNTYLEINDIIFIDESCTTILDLDCLADPEACAAQCEAPNLPAGWTATTSPNQFAVDACDETPIPRVVVKFSNFVVDPNTFFYWDPINDIDQ